MMNNIIYFFTFDFTSLLQSPKELSAFLLPRKSFYKTLLIIFVFKWRGQEIGGIQLVSLFATLFLQNIVEEWLLVLNYRYFLR